MIIAYLQIESPLSNRRDLHMDNMLCFDQNNGLQISLERHQTLLCCSDLVMHGGKVPDSAGEQFII